MIFIKKKQFNMIKLQILKKKKSHSYIHRKANFTLSETLLSPQTFCVCYNKSLLYKRVENIEVNAKIMLLKLCSFLLVCEIFPDKKWKRVCVNKNCKETLVF